MASPAAHRIDVAPAAQPDLPDEILEDIFVRLDSTADLARASAACATFRRVVSSRRFLRRYRSLHSPPVLGGIVADHGKFHPAEPPHRSAPAARAAARAADFTFSFLPNPEPNRRRTRDVRDGRVLLSASAASSSLDDLVVCDPLHRRYVEIPPIPGDQMPSMLQFDEYDRQEFNFEPFLAPASEEEKESSSFRVICNVLYGSRVMAFVFSSITGHWQRVSETHHGFGSIYPDMFVRHYAHNCFYWTYPWRNRLLVLDMGEMEFSFIGLPSDPSGRPWCSVVPVYAIVEFEEGSIGFIADYNGMLELYLRDDGVGEDEWRHLKTITLPEHRCLWFVLGATEGYLLLRCLSQQMPDPQYFTLHLKTLQIERLCTMSDVFMHCHLYASFHHNSHCPVYEMGQSDKCNICLMAQE